MRSFYREKVYTIFRKIFHSHDKFIKLPLPFYLHISILGMDLYPLTPINFNFFYIVLDGNKPILTFLDRKYLSMSMRARGREKANIVIVLYFIFRDHKIFGHSNK